MTIEPYGVAIAVQEAKDRTVTMQNGATLHFTSGSPDPLRGMDDRRWWPIDLGEFWPLPHIAKDNAGLWTIINYHERIDSPHAALFDKAWLWVRSRNFPAAENPPLGWRGATL